MVNRESGHESTPSENGIYGLYFVLISKNHSIKLVSRHFTTVRQTGTDCEASEGPFNLCSGSDAVNMALKYTRSMLYILFMEALIVIAILVTMCPKLC
jgi:hypothetical protein